MVIKVINLQSPDVKHILSSENKSNIDSKYYWKFKSKYTISLEIDGNIVNITIPEKFESDGGTIPRIFGYFRGLAFRGYFVHDFLYTNHIYPRKMADKILRECLKYECVSCIDRNIIYLVVRLFGSKHYKIKGE